MPVEFHLSDVDIIVVQLSYTLKGIGQNPWPLPTRFQYTSETKYLQTLLYVPSAEEARDKITPGRETIQPKCFLPPS